MGLSRHSSRVKPSLEKDVLSEDVDEDDEPEESDTSTEDEDVILIMRKEGKRVATKTTKILLLSIITEILLLPSDKMRKLRVVYEIFYDLTLKAGIQEKDCSSQGNFIGITANLQLGNKGLKYCLKYSSLLRERDVTAYNSIGHRQ
jgi:hypothetical protein